jgi:hypothetical protein
MSSSLDTFTEEEINLFYISYDEGFIGTLEDFSEFLYDLDIVSSTTSFDTFEYAKENLISYWNEQLEKSKEGLKHAKNLKYRYWIKTVK